MSESDVEQWFADLPPRPSPGTTPMHDLARESSRALVGSHAVGRTEWPAEVAPDAQTTRLSAATPQPSAASPSGADDLDSFLDSQAELWREKTRQKRKDSDVSAAWHTRRGTLVAAAAAIAAVAVVATVLAVTLSGSDPSESTVAQPSSVAPTQTGSATAKCPSSVSGSVTTGADAGGQTSGQGVIKAFNYAYYVERSAAKAKAVTTPNAVATEDVMQKFINQRGVGTTHCLSIADRGNNTYGVTLTESPPNGGAPIVYQQTISTVQAGGKYWISSIKSEN